MDALVQAIEGGAINTWILSSYWLWPVLEIIHFIGLSLLLGAMLIVDLRLAGFLRQIDIMATQRLLPWIRAAHRVGLGKVASYARVPLGPVRSATLGVLERKLCCAIVWTIVDDAMPLTRYRTWGALVEAAKGGTLRVSLGS